MERAVLTDELVDGKPCFYLEYRIHRGRHSTMSENVLQVINHPSGEMILQLSVTSTPSTNTPVAIVNKYMTEKGIIAGNILAL
jgi:hypothetical protein